MSRCLLIISVLVQTSSPLQYVLTCLITIIRKILKQIFDLMHINVHLDDLQNNNIVLGFNTALLHQYCRNNYYDFALTVYTKAF